MATVVAAPSSYVMIVRSDELGWPAVCEAARSCTRPRAVIEAREASEALRLAEEYQPRLVLAPGSLHGSSTVPLVAGLRQILPAASSIMAICTASAATDADALFQAGASSCLLWDELTTDLIPHLFAVAMALDGRLHVGCAAESSVVRGSRGSWASHPRLTARETMVLAELGRGLTQRQIAQKLALSPRTVRRLVTQTQRKLGVHTSFTLGLRAGKLGLVDST
jgi:DNA-binding NarL/FixJ family response regulator